MGPFFICTLVNVKSRYAFSKAYTLVPYQGVSRMQQSMQVLVWLLLFNKVKFDSRYITHINSYCIDLS